MADENHCTPGVGNIAHLAQTLALEVGIANCQNFIHHQDFRFQVGCHGESQAQVHARGVAFDRGIDELFNFRECHDLIETGFDFLFMHAKNGAVEEDVLASGQFGVKTGAYLQQRAYATAQLAIAFGWVGHAREDLEQRALAGSVAPDNAQCLPAFDLKVDIPQSPDVIRFGGIAPFSAQGAADTCRLGGDEIAQGVATLLSSANLVALANTLNNN